MTVTGIYIALHFSCWSPILDVLSHWKGNRVAAKHIFFYLWLSFASIFWAWLQRAMY